MRDSREKVHERKETEICLKKPTQKQRPKSLEKAHGKKKKKGKRKIQICCRKPTHNTERPKFAGKTHKRCKTATNLFSKRPHKTGPNSMEKAPRRMQEVSNFAGNPPKKDRLKRPMQVRCQTPTHPKITRKSLKEAHDSKKRPICLTERTHMKETEFDGNGAQKRWKKWKSTKHRVCF